MVKKSKIHTEPDMEIDYTIISSAFQTLNYCSRNFRDFSLYYRQTTISRYVKALL